MPISTPSQFCHQMKSAVTEHISNREKKIYYTVRYLDEERASWSERFPDPVSDVRSGGARPC
jgi:hypothetical protein